MSPTTSKITPATARRMAGERGYRLEVAQPPIRCTNSKIGKWALYREGYRVPVLYLRCKSHFSSVTRRSRRRGVALNFHAPRRGHTLRGLQTGEQCDAVKSALRDPGSRLA